MHLRQSPPPQKTCSNGPAGNHTSTWGMHFGSDRATANNTHASACLRGRQSRCAFYTSGLNVSQSTAPVIRVPAASPRRASRRARHRSVRRTRRRGGMRSGCNSSDLRGGTEQVRAGTAGVTFDSNTAPAAALLLLDAGRPQGSCTLLQTSTFRQPSFWRDYTTRARLARGRASDHPPCARPARDRTSDYGTLFPPRVAVRTPRVGCS